MDTGKRTATKMVTKIAKPLPERRLVAISLRSVAQDMTLGWIGDEMYSLVSEKLFTAARGFLKLS